MGNIIAKDRENMLKPLTNDLLEKRLELTILRIIEKSKTTDIKVLISNAELDIENIKSQMIQKHKEMSEISAQSSMEQNEFLQQWW